MNKKTLDGVGFAKLLQGGAASLAAHMEELNALNIFPVADGDTGTNMCKTMAGGLGELTEEETASIGTVAKQFARGVLLGARGN